MNLRQQLVEISLKWQAKYGVAPQVTSALSEYDAAMLIGATEDEYSKHMQNQTAVTKGVDFVYNNKRYQVKANRPSGKRGSAVTLVSKAKNYEWDFLIWVLYNTTYNIQEAWLWPVDRYKAEYDSVKRLSPDHMRKGKRLK